MTYYYPLVKQADNTYRRYGGFTSQDEASAWVKSNPDKVGANAELVFVIGRQFNSDISFNDF